MAKNVDQAGPASLPAPDHLQLDERPGDQRQYQPGDQHPDDRQPRRLLRLVESVEQTALFADVACGLGPVESDLRQRMPSGGLHG